jgi:hypothetical protein
MKSNSINVTEDKKEGPVYFGKKHKSVEENASCFYSVSGAYLANQSDVKKAQQFDKYLTRMKDIVNGNMKPLSNQENLVTLAKNQYFNKVLVKLITNAVKLQFEHKKNLINIVHDIFKIMDGEIQPNAKYLETSVNFIDIANMLLDNYVVEDMNFFSGNILRIFVKQENLLKKTVKFHLFG